MCMFRDLKAHEIDVRVGRVKDTGIQLLLYKDARVDMNILDEVVGQARWQREHYEVKNNLYCRVGIKIGDEWIWKSDCGAESNTEAEKGEASDSFKRACTNWGIGRELYTAPFIWVNADKCNIKKITFNGKDTYKCDDTFSVVSINIRNKEIVAIKIKNDKTGAVCYTYGESGEHYPPSVPFPEVEKKPPEGAKAPNPIVGTTLANKRDWAVKFKLDGGLCLGELRKVDKQRYARLRANPPSPECAEAIRIIDEWVSSAQ